MSRRYESVFPVSHDGPLELARVLLRPALYHNLLLRVELNRVVSLSVQYSEETVFPSAKGEVCISRKFLSVVLENYERDGNIVEKYNMVTRSSDVKVAAGYQMNAVGFGWTNGVFLKLMDELSAEEHP